MESGELDRANFLMEENCCFLMEIRKRVRKRSENAIKEIMKEIETLKLGFGGF